MEWLCANTLTVIIVQINEQKILVSGSFIVVLIYFSWILYDSVGLLMFLVYFSFKVPISCSFISFKSKFFYVTILRPTLLYNFRVFFPMCLFVSCLFL